MICEVCGAENPTSAYKCGKCGNSFREEKEQAFQDAVAQVQAQPDSYIAHCNMGRAHYSKRDVKQAISELDIAIQLSKDSPDLSPHYALADIYFETEREAQAVQVLSSAIIEKLDNFRGAGLDMDQLESCDKLLRLSYFNQQIREYNSWNAAMQRGYREGMQNEGFASPEEFYQFTIRDEIGTYDLARQLRSATKSAGKKGCSLLVLLGAGSTVLWWLYQFANHPG